MILNRLTNRTVRALVLGIGSLALLAGGCTTPRSTEAMAESSPPRRARPSDIRGVRCLYDQKPWINADAAGDADPEGVRYRVFLDPGKGDSVLRNGTFHVELYQINRSETGVERVLVSDWKYPTSEFGTVASNILGKGYQLQLRWAKKDIAGHEVELITQYIDPHGNAVRSATKRLRVPKYAS